jgi:anti-anti-sigma regulatory factor
MEITISLWEANQQIAIMKIKGEINASNFMELVNKAREIYNNPSRNLIIDLSEVSAVSTTGLVAVHQIALIYSGIPQKVEQDANPDFTHSSNARKYVKLLSPQPEVDKELEKAGLKLFFKVFLDLDSAVQSFS